MQASRHTWTYWLAQVNSFCKQLDQRSYATVVKQGKAVVQTKTALKKSTNSNKIVNKWLVSDNTNTSTTTRPRVQKICHEDKKIVHFNRHNTRHSTIPVTNRFHVLQDHLQTTTTDCVVSNSLCCKTAKSLKLQGNKNGIGQTLGVAVQNKQYTDMLDSFDCNFKGNKNKTGRSLGQSNVEEGHSSSSTTTDTNQLQ